MIAAHELAIVIITPQDGFSGYTRYNNVYEDQVSLFHIDGIEIQQMVHAYTSGANYYRYSVAHELGHLVLGLGDMYWSGIDLYSEPGTFALMGNPTLTFPQMGSVNRVALGWLTPWAVKQTGFVYLESADTAMQTYYLPRTGSGDGLEQFMLEFRSPVASVWDETGVAIWHRVEGPDRAFPPFCIANTPEQNTAWSDVGGNDGSDDKQRTGVRMVKPSVDGEGWHPMYGLTNDYLWDGWDDYSAGAFAAVCPTECDDPPCEEDARATLDWADSNVSGYVIDFMVYPDWAPGGAIFVNVP